MSATVAEGARHFLVVTYEPVAESDRAEYDAADAAERRDWDRDRRSINVECAGLDQTCFGWVECRLPHTFTEDELDEGEASAHGVWHQHFYFGWAVEGDRCGLYQFSDAWCDTASDLAEELGEGRHPIDFEWEDEYTILMHSTPAPPVTVPEPEGGDEG